MATRTLKQLEKMNAPRPVSRAKSVSSGSMHVGTKGDEARNVKEMVGARKRNAITSSANTAHRGTFDSYPSGATKDKSAANRAVNAVADYSGMKNIHVANAAATGVKKGFNSASYKDKINTLAEGDAKNAKAYTRVLKNGTRRKK